MSVTVQQLAELVHGQVIGDGKVVISAARPFPEARAGDITFVTEEKLAQQLAKCGASAVVVSGSKSPEASGKVLLQVHDPLEAFVTIVRHLHGRPECTFQGIHARACVDPTAQVGADCAVYALAVIGESSILGARCRIHSGAVIGRFCRLGDDVTIYPNAVLYDGAILGNRVIVHANAVLGADGFGYRTQKGRHVKMPQLGHVEIGDDVEIGACTTIDSGTFQATRVGEGTKIDNLVQIGHNCQIGRHNLLVSQMGIAGSSSTGDYVVVAGQAGIVDHIHIGEGTVIGGQAAVTKDVAPGLRLLGTPATPEREQKRIMTSLEKLPEIRRDVRRIKQHLGLKDEEAA